MSAAERQVPPFKPPTSYSGKLGVGAVRYVDTRLTSANFLRRSLNKVFPDHWSFMLGEIALYTFVILLLSGTYLAFFYSASLEEVVYDGSYAPLRGVEMSIAYATTLDLSFDVRGGLLMRQIHHWAALLFVASIVVHLARVFFTGAFRKPREINWAIGVVLLILSIFEGFMGYSLPDDLLSGTGLRIGYSIALAIPVVGSHVAFIAFGGPFPGDGILERLYIAHVWIFPLIFLGLIGAHMGILWFQKHTQFRGPGRTENNVVGSRVFPVFGAKTIGFFFFCFGVIALMGGVTQINPIWLYGPYDPAQVSAGSQPDWYVGWLDGATRLMFGVETQVLGYTVAWNILVPALVIPGILFTLLTLYPWLEAKFSGDRDYHNLLDRPRDAPVRTSVGVASLGFYIVLLISGGNDVIAETFNLSVNSMTWAGRIGLIVVPPILYWLTYRLCLSLQRSDHERFGHGIETGVIKRLPTGEFVEVTVPVPRIESVVLRPVESDHAEHGALESGRHNEAGTGGDHRGVPGHSASAATGRHPGMLSSAGRAVGGFFNKRSDGQPSDPNAPADRNEPAGQQ
jgi:ubiquinol-cytochrome c reductase cytochrome b subunit